MFVTEHPWLFGYIIVGLVCLTFALMRALDVLRYSMQITSTDPEQTMKDLSIGIFLFMVAMCVVWPLSIAALLAQRFASATPAHVSEIGLQRSTHKERLVIDRAEEFYMAVTAEPEKTEEEEEAAAEALFEAIDEMWDEREGPA